MLSWFLSPHPWGSRRSRHPHLKVKGKIYVWCQGPCCSKGRFSLVPVLLPWILQHFPPPGKPPQSSAAISNSFRAHPCSGEWHLPGIVRPSQDGLLEQGGGQTTLSPPRDLFCVIFYRLAPFPLPVFCEKKKKSENVSCKVVSSSSRTHRPSPARLFCPQDFLGKNTGVGCHFLLQGIFPTQGLNPHLNWTCRLFFTIWTTSFPCLIPILRLFWSAPSCSLGLLSAGFLDTTLPKYRSGLTAQLRPLYACPDLEPSLCRLLWSGDPSVRQAFPYWSCRAVLPVPDGMKLFAPTRVLLAKRRCALVPALLCRTPLLGTFQSFQDLGLRFLNSASSITHQNIKL